MYFSIEDDDLLEIYSGIRNKVSNGIKKELDCLTVVRLQIFTINKYL